MKQILLFLTLFINSLAYSQVDLNLGLVAYFPFNGNANDVSGNNINGNVNNATLTTDRAGQSNSAYYFNGSSSYIQLPYSPLYNFAPNDSFTITVRVLPDQGYTWPAQALVVKSPIQPDFNTSLWNYGTYISNYRAMTGYAFNNVLTGSTVFTGIPCWYNIVATYKNGTWKLFVNGVLESSDLSQTKFILQDGPASKINFGKKGDSNGDWYKGKMDDIRIYHRVLNQDEINILSGCSNIAPCDSWLKTQATGSFASVGDIDVSGNQITVEASFNRTAPANSTGGNGFVVSKHTTTGTINYALWPNGCAITTTNGDVLTFENCGIQLNKTYHVAMVYNGSVLKFYRNGFLLSQAPATGNLFLNDLLTTIGQCAGLGYPEINQFLGNINEVRIWNVARTQTQLQTYMNSSLPSPTTQTGLLGYYVFDNLLNKQGNTVYNGALNGGATINTTNPNCNFIADSCSIIIPPGISNIINEYTPVLALNPCTNKITVEDATKFNTGDTVLMIQMKGAVIDSTNSSSFGNIIDYKNSGNYEFNYVKAKAGNIIELKNKLTRQYDIPAGKVQLIRVPYYNSVNVNNILTCLPWDGNKGGVLAFNVRDTVTLNADINLSGKGFKGGLGYNANNGSLGCFNNGYSYPLTFQLSGDKGESIATISNNITRGKGKLAAAGGAGLGHNSGAGGGANAGNGGFGGYQLDNCGSAPFDNRGIGGQSLQYNTATNKVFMGSGGGGGQADNIGYTASDGGNGGGLIFITANYLRSNAKKIIANGVEASACVQPDCHDAMGGGGAGGTVLMAVNNYIDNATVNRDGGKGGSVLGNILAGGRIGPGGGGGGGTLFINNPSLPAAITSTSLGGANGVLVNSGNESWGATAGTAGLNVFNLVLAIDTVLFKPNIDSVRIKDSTTSCLAFDFKGFGYTNTNPIASWNWYFGDGGTANTQSTSHTYATAGTFTVRLVVTDINGCKDSITRNVVSNTISVNAGSDSSFCGGPVTVQLQSTVTGTGNFSWTPAAYLNNNTLSNPTATINATTIFYLTVTNSSGCTGKDSVTIYVGVAPVLQTLNDTAVCKGSTLVLTTTTGFNTYHWSPGIYVNDSTIANPFFIDTITRTLIITGSIGTCSSADTIIVTVKSLPVVNAGSDTVICGTQTVTLSASGASLYSWSPAIFLSNTNTANPVFSGNVSATYFLTGTGANGCKGKDTVSINVNNPNSLVQPRNKTFCSKETVSLDGGNGNTVQYLWSPPTWLSNSTIINPIANPPASTTYTVKITDPGCNFDSTFTVLVTERPLPVVTASSSNDIDCALKNARLTTTGALQYLWYPPATLNSSNNANPIATPTITTQYVVTGTDNNGCKNKDSVTVLVKDGLSGYDIPNSFTPNGDGLNDCFGIKHWGNAQNVIFIIYSRWGEKVFETNNVNTCWDGKYKGQPANIGNFVYYASGRTACGDIVIKGNVLLIR